MPNVIGLITSLSKLSTNSTLKTAFNGGLTAGGLTGTITYGATSTIPGGTPVGANDAYIWEQAAAGDYTALPTFASNISAANAYDVIVAAGGLISSQAIQKDPSIATGKVRKRLIFTSGRLKEDNPIHENKPYSTAGIYLGTTKKNHEDIETRKRLLELLGKQAQIFHLVNTDSVVSDDESRWQADQVVANNTGSGAFSVAQAFADAKKGDADALVVSADPFFMENRTSIVNQAATDNLPTCYPFREYVDAGGFMSHGPSLSAVYRQLGLWAAMLVKNDKLAPHKLPPAKNINLELVINTTTAGTLASAGKIKKARLNKLLDVADATV